MKVKEKAKNFIICPKCGFKTLDSHSPYLMLVAFPFRKCPSCKKLFLTHTAKNITE